MSKWKNYTFSMYAGFYCPITSVRVQKPDGHWKKCCCPSITSARYRRISGCAKKSLGKEVCMHSFSQGPLTYVYGKPDFARCKVQNGLQLRNSPAHVEHVCYLFNSSLTFMYLRTRPPVLLWISLKYHVMYRWSDSSLRRTLPQRTCYPVVAYIHMLWQRQA